MSTCPCPLHGSSAGPAGPLPRRGILARLCLAALVLAGVMPAWADTVRLGGTGSAIGTMQRLGEAYRALDPGFRLEVVPNLGSSGGIKAVGAGAVQIGAASRPLKPDEVAAGLQAIEYGRTAFVLTTAHPGVQNLSLREVAELFGGQRARWADGTPVRLVLRPTSDGDSALLGQFSPEIQAALAQAQSREGMVVGMTDQDTVDAVERLPGGLGTATTALLLSEQRRARPLSIDGVAPTLENLASGRYPHQKAMYLVLRPDAPQSARKFVAFVASEAGQRLLVQLGHVPASARKTAASPSSGR